MCRRLALAVAAIAGGILLASDAAGLPVGTFHGAAVPDQPITFAVIGDYGSDGPDAAAVADLVASWYPSFVATTGDNNYPEGEGSTIDANVGQYYHAFIAPYRGAYGEGASSNRFWPVLGNHDWYTAGAAPYLDYFTLPGNERYNSHEEGPVGIFALDSDPEEPDGVTATSAQAGWLRTALGASAACWKLAFLHHPPYSSGEHGSSAVVQWPYRDWGAAAVLAGHDHTYERIVRDDFPYFVNGLGGRSAIAQSDPIEPASRGARPCRRRMPFA